MLPTVSKEVGNLLSVLYKLWYAFRKFGDSEYPFPSRTMRITQLPAVNSNRATKPVIGAALAGLDMAP